MYNYVFKMYYKHIYFIILIIKNLISNIFIYNFNKIIKLKIKIF